jgi:hypothetical protein
MFRCVNSRPHKSRLQLSIFPKLIPNQTLHADSPVDASLFSLYVQQNYTQFCDDVDECMSLADALSEADGGMGILDDSVSFPVLWINHASIL